VSKKEWLRVLLQPAGAWCIRLYCRTNSIAGGESVFNSCHLGRTDPGRCCRSRETVGPSTICITLRPTTSPAAGLSRATLGRAVRLAGRAPRRARSACWRLPRPYCDGREADEERMVRGDRSWPAVYAPYRPSSY